MSQDAVELKLRLEPVLDASGKYYCAEVSSELMLQSRVTAVNKPNVLVDKSGQKFRLMTVSCIFISTDSGRRFTETFLSRQMLQVLGVSEDELPSRLKDLRFGRYHVKLIKQ